MHAHHTNTSSTSHPDVRTPPAMPLAALIHAVVVGALGAAAAVAPFQKQWAPLPSAPQEPTPTTIPVVENQSPDMCQILVEAAPYTVLLLHRVSERGSEARSEAIANEHGAHRFIDLVPGTYHLTAFFDDGALASAPTVRCVGDTLRASVALSRPASTTEITGRVVGHGGTGAQGAEILVDQPEGHRHGLLGPAHVPVQDDGTFRARVPTGRLVVLATAPHHAPNKVELSLTEARPVDVPLVLTWRPEAHGRVVDAAGRPVAGALVSVGPHHDPRRAPPTATTRDDGTFTIDVAPGRTFTLTARAEGGIDTVRLSPVKETAGVHDVELRLGEGRSVMGFVQDQKGGVRAFTDVLVRVKEHGIVDTVRTDHEGRFVVRGLPTDDVELWPKDGAIGAWGGAVADAGTRGVMLTYVAPAY
mgnify:CR=1 FL=1